MRAIARFDLYRKAGIHSLVSVSVPFLALALSKIHCDSIHCDSPLFVLSLSLFAERCQQLVGLGGPHHPSSRR